MTHVYTDGSTVDNGAATARGGCGVWFGENDPRNLSVPYPGPATNQRCELYAVQLALEVPNVTQPLTIYTDSKYVIGCITSWRHTWEQNGWKNSKGHPVANASLIRDVLARLPPYGVHFVHVKAHSGIRGNEEADRLANEGRVGAPPHRQ